MVDRYAVSATNSFSTSRICFNTTTSIVLAYPIAARATSIRYNTQVKLSIVEAKFVVIGSFLTGQNSRAKIYFGLPLLTLANLQA
jgi:hypothetical protein